MRRPHRWCTYFNSRPSARGDEYSASQRFRASIFQFTPLREGRPAHNVRQIRHNHFNSRPSARGDYTGRVTMNALESISIHAPPRGATWSSLRSMLAPTFQFTPLREGRPKPA